MLKLDKVCKNYGNGKGVENISFQMKAGKICGLLGSNGCGKTTTFRLLLHLLDVDSGEIMYNKKPLDHNDFCLFGYVPEDRSMLRNLTLKEHVYYLGRLKSMKC